MKNILILIATLCVLTACNNEETISLEEHENLQAENKMLKEDNKKLNTQLDNVISENSELRKQIEEQVSIENSIVDEEESVQAFLDELEADLDDIEYTYNELSSQITVTYTGELEEVTELALSQKENTSAYENDLQAIREIIQLYSETIMQKFGEGYTVALQLESNPIPALIIYEDGEYLVDTFESHTKRILNK